MKKIISILLVVISILLVVNLFAMDWYHYIGKRVRIEMTGNTIYIGVVRTIVDIEICKQKDAFGNCIYKEYFYTLYLEQKYDIISIPCESISKIEELI